MKDYYLSINGEQSGPFSIDELKKMELNDKYLVWNKGFVSWLNASEVFHLKESVIKLPPPLPDKKFAESKAINKALLDSLLPFLLILLLTLVANGGFLSDYDLQKVYSIYYSNPDYSPNYNTSSISSQIYFLAVSSSQIRVFVFVGSFALALIPSLFFLIIDYRYRIKREILRISI